MGTLSIFPGSAPFSVDPDGTVRVKNSSSLDRESSSWIAFQVGLRRPEDGSVRQDFEDWSERRPPPLLESQGLARVPLLSLWRWALLDKRLDEP